MNIFTSFILSFIFLLSPTWVAAQYQVSPVGKKDFSFARQRKGLILDQVYDNSGLLWIGGSNGAGLMRFDGKQFSSIPVPYFGTDDFSVIDMHKDRKGRIYILFWNRTPSLLMLDPLTLQFTPVQYKGIKDSIERISRTFEKNGHLYSIVQDTNQISLFELHDATATKVVDFKISRPIEINHFAVFIPYPDAYLLMADGLGTVLFNKKGELIRTISRKSPGRGFSLVTLKGRYLFMMDNQPYLYTYLPKKQKLKPLIDFGEKITPSIYSFWNDARGHLLLSTADSSGLSVFNVTLNGITKYLDIGDMNVIDWPLFFSKDATQSLWIANQLEPLTFYRLSQPKVRRFLENKRIGAIYQQDTNEFLISTVKSGWFSLDLSKNRIHPFRLWKDNKPFAALGLRLNIIPDKNKRYLWTNLAHGIGRVDVKTHQVRTWGNVTVQALARLNDSLLIYGTYKNGLWSFNTQTQKQQMLFPGKMYWIKDLLIQDQIIYAATSEGLLVYDRAHKKAAYFQLPESERSRRRKNGVFNCLLYQPGKGVIIGTDAGIVYRFDLKTKTYYRLFENANRAGIQTMFFNKGKLWMNTKQGIFSWDTLSHQVQHFSDVDGLSYNETSRFSVLQTAGGVFVGTRQGLNYFDPSSLHPLVYNAQLIPLSLVKFNEETDKPDTINNRQVLADMHQIELPAEYRFFRLHFAMAHRNNSAPVHFKYKLGDGDWTAVTEGNYVQFENLAPGKYLLKVSAFDAYGNPVGHPLQYELKAKDFFYKHWWFAAAVVLVMLTIIGFIIFSTKQRKTLKLKLVVLDSLRQSKKDKEEKLRMERLLLEEMKRTLEVRKRELVAGSLQMANLKNYVKKTMKDYKNGVDPELLTRRLTRQLSQEDEWDLFMKKFVGVYPAFLKNLQRAYPGLSQKDLEFCALIKLNLSNKEIATLLNISHQSIITKKYRLRKKMNLNENGANHSLEDKIAKI